MPAIFVSHSSRDGDIAHKIMKALSELGYDNTFLDFDKDSGIGVGEDWERRLYSELTRCHAVLLVLTPHWLASKWCFAELAQARAQGKVILPLACAPMKEVVLPGVQAVDLVDWEGDGLHRVAQRLQAVTQDLARGFKLAPHRSPFPGINSFEEDDAAIFFGRDSETRLVIERLDARRIQGGARIVTIIGASGAGKSSLLKAGLLPQLKRRRTHWILLPTIRPEKSPLEAFAKALAEVQGEPRAWRDWLDRMRRGEASAAIGELAKDLRVGGAKAATLLLPIDQIEELFTISDATECATFVKLLSSLLDPSSDVPLMSVATGRADILHGILEASELAPLTETLPLVMMPLDRVPSLVEGPAAVCSLVVEPTLVERIKRDVERSEALPLLAYTLRLLYQACAESKYLTVANYEALGDAQGGLNPVQNSVRLAADTAIAGVKPTASELSALRDAFVPHLVRLRLTDGARVRQVAAMTALPREADRLIQALTNARLLITRTEDGQAIVEVAHESLFAAWPTLSGWLNDEKAFLVDVERLRDAYDAWSQTDEAHRSDALLHGLLLANARDWLVKHPQRFIAHDMEKLRSFVLDSAAAEDAAHERSRVLRRRVFRATVAASLVLLVASVVTGWQYNRAESALQVATEEEAVARQQRDQAQRSLISAQINESNYLTNTAEDAVRTHDLERAGLVARLALPQDVRHPNRPLWPPAVGVLAKVRSLDRTDALLVGHRGAVWSASWSPDGRKLLTTSSDKTVRLWDTATGAFSMVFPTQPAAALAGAWSPDGRRVVAASGQNATIYNAENGYQLAILSGHSDVIWSVAWSPRGDRILTGSSDKTVRLWNAISGEQIAILDGHTDAVWGVAWSPDGSQFVTGSADKTIRIWDAKTGTTTAVITGHTAAVHSVAWSPDGKRIVSASDDQTARIWDAASHAQLTVLSGHKGAVICAVWSPNGASIATASQDATARVWDAASGAATFMLSGHSNLVRSVAWSPDGRQIATASWDKSGRIWHAKAVDSVAALKGHGDWVYSAAWSPDDRRIATASEDKTARLWDVETSRLLLTLSGHTDRVHSANWSPDGTKIVTASWDKTARIWDAGTGASLAELKGHTRGVNDAGWSPDGSRIVTASLDGTAVVWDAKLYSKVLELSGHTDAVLSAAYSPDGKRIVTGSGDNTARVWDASTGAQLLVLKGDTDAISSAVWSPDGKRILTASRDDTARIWDGETGAQLTIFEGRTDHIWSAGWSPDGTRVLTTSGGDTAIIWDVESGAPLQILNAAGAGIWGAAYKHDGTQIATASRDDTARIWDAWPLLCADTVIYATISEMRALRPDEIAPLFMEKPAAAVARAGPAAQSESVTGMTQAQLTAAAAAGNPFAHRHLAREYELGENVPANIETALFHHAVETLLFEKAGLADEAALARARRGSDARAVSPEAAVRAADAAAAWKATDTPPRNSQQALQTPPQTIR